MQTQQEMTQALIAAGLPSDVLAAPALPQPQAPMLALPPQPDNRVPTPMLDAGTPPAAPAQIPQGLLHPDLSNPRPSQGAPIYAPQISAADAERMNQETRDDHARMNVSAINSQQRAADRAAGRPVAGAVDPSTLVMKKPAAAAPAAKASGGGAGANPYGSYFKAKTAEGDALDAMAQAEQYRAEDDAVAARRRADELQQQQADTMQRAQERDQEVQRQIGNLDEMSRQAAAKKLDPDRWYKNQSTGEHVMWGLAAALGGFAQGFTKGAVPNAGLDAMYRHADADLASQKEEIESAKGRVGDARGILAETYRRFGDMDQAMSAARILTLQQMDAQAAAMAAQSNSATAAAKYQLLHAQNNTEIAKERANFAVKAAGAGAMTPMQQAQLEKTLAETDAIRAKTSGAGGAEAAPDAPEMSFGEAVQSYLMPGSAAGLKRTRMEQHNLGAAGVVHKNVGLKGEAAIHGAAPYSASPFMPNALIRQHNEALRKNFGKGGANLPVDDDVPEDFDKIGDDE